MEIRAFFEEYDRLSDTADDATLEKLLTDTCTAYRGENPADYLGQSALYNELGSFYRARGVYGRGEEAFLAAKKILEHSDCTAQASGTSKAGCVGCGPLIDYANAPENGAACAAKDLTETCDYATTLNNLAGLYRLWGNYSKALELFGAAAERYAKLENLPADVHASCHNNMGLVYLHLKQGQAAEACFGRALGILEGAEERDYARGTTLSNLAFALLLSEKKEDAAGALKTAAQCFLSASGSEDELYQNCIAMLKKLERPL
ncbi:MAG: tetratricopeptide repeat protein [Oscillospiraceae bacterium]